MEINKALTARDLLDKIDNLERKLDKFDSEIIEIEFKCIDNENRKCKLFSIDNSNKEVLKNIVSYLKSNYETQVQVLIKKINNI